MRIFAYSICLILALALMPGCGKKEKVADNQPAAQNDQPKTNNTGNQARRNVPEQVYDKKGRPLPSVGGGENGPGPRINSNTSTSGNGDASSNTSNSNSKTVPMLGGLANGLFPQMGAGNLNPGKLGGGLFPQAANSSTGSVSSGPTSNTSIPVNNTSNVSAKAETKEKEVSAKGEFFDNATAEFKRGNSEKAMKYLYAYALSSNDALDEYPMKWHAGIKRPRIGLRWGVGIVRGGSLDGRAPVIGEGVEGAGSGSANNDDQPSISSGGRRPGGSSTEKSIYEKVDTSTPNGLLLYYTGDFGAQVVSEFASRRKSDAEFGKIFKDMPEVMPEVDSSETASANQANTPPRDNRIGAQARRNRVLPSVGGGGGPGAPPGGRPGAQAGNNQPSTGGASSLVARWTTGNTSTPRNNTVGELTPGLTLLGVGDPKTIAKRALENNIDCLLLIKINGKKRRDEEQSTTSLKLVDIEKPTQSITGTSNLSNVKVMNDRENGTDPVESSLSRFFESEQVAELEATSMPEIGPEFVTKRVKLLADEAADPLRDAVEVMHFYREGLVSEEDAINAIESLIGNGETFVTGSEGERQKAAADLVGN